MSKTFGIDIYLSPAHCDFMTYFNLLMESGWTYRTREGKVVYTPLGASFGEFIVEELEDEIFFKIIEKKLKKKETFLIGIWWKEDRKITLDLIYSGDGALTFVPDADAKTYDIHGFSILDVNWYMEKLIGPLVLKNIPFEGVEWSEIYL